MRKLFAAVIAVGFGAASIAAGCGSKNNACDTFDCGGSSGSSGGTSSGASSGGNASSSSGGGSNGGGTHLDDDGSVVQSLSDGATCENLQCLQHTCGDGGTTTISGSVYDPAMKNPLYDVVVYVPNATPEPITDGVNSGSCSCESLYTGEPIASTLTRADGTFTLENVPDTATVPLVIQIGKWRRQLTISNVQSCVDNPQPDKSLALPSKAGPKDDIPSIAVSTGGADSLECLLIRAGVDPTEYTPGAGGTGHIHIFQGCSGQSCGLIGQVGPPPNTSPSAPASDTALWDQNSDIDPYDIVLLSCEGTETTNPAPQVLYDYVNGGGRVFAEHYHFAWFTGQTGDPFPSTIANWQVSLGAPYSGTINADVVQTLTGGAAFPKGVALNTWLGKVGALTGGELPITVARADAQITATNPLSQAWIETAAGVSPVATQYFSFDMPFDAGLDDAGDPEYCGRVVFSDLHVGAAANDYGGATANPNGHTNTITTPSGCTTGDLSPDEKALEFMLFDLSSCVTPVTAAPKPPPIPTPPIK